MEIKKCAKRGILPLFISLILVLVAFSAGMGIAAAADPIVSIQPSQSTVCVGDDFNVYIQVNPNGNILQMVQCDLGFNSPLASLTVADGGMFDTFNAGIQSGNMVTDITGLDLGVSTTGNLAVLHMHAASAGTFTLDLSNVKTGTASGTLTPVVNDGTVTISDCVGYDFCFTLEPGWNFVSIPKPITPVNATVLFNLSQGEMAFYYNASAGTVLNGNIIVKPCQGYLVYKTKEDRICIYYNRNILIPPQEKLYEGWNMIGHIDDTTWGVEEFLSNTGLEGKCTILAALEYQGMPLQSVDFQYCYPASPRLSEFDEMIPGWGYLAYLTEDTMMPGTTA